MFRTRARPVYYALTEGRAFPLHAVQCEGGGVSHNKSIAKQLDELNVIRTQDLLHLLVSRFRAVDFVDVNELLGGDAQTRAARILTNHTRAKY